MGLYIAGFGRYRLDLFAQSRHEHTQGRRIGHKGAAPYLFQNIIVGQHLPSLPLANYLHNKIFPDFARFSLLFFASYVIIIM